MSRLLAGLAVAVVWAAAATPAFEQGLRHYGAEDYEKAQRSFEAALAEEPGSSERNLWLALAIGRRLQTMSAIRRLGAVPLVRRVKRHFELAVELDGANIDALKALVGFYLDAPPFAGGSNGSAREVAERIRQLDPAQGALATAACHEGRGEHEEAATQLALSRVLAPDDIGAILAHAGFLARRAEHAASDGLFDLAFRLDGDNPAVWSAAARAWITVSRKDRYSEARDFAERYLDTPKSAPDAEPYFEIRALLKKLPRSR